MYISINVGSFIMVTFQLILITQVVSVLQVKLEYKWRKKATRKTIHLIYLHFLNRTCDQSKLQAMTEYYDIEQCSVRLMSGLFFFYKENLEYKIVELSRALL